MKTKKTEIKRTNVLLAIPDELLKKIDWRVKFYNTDRTKLILKLIEDSIKKEFTLS